MASQAGGSRAASTEEPLCSLLSCQRWGASLLFALLWGRVAAFAEAALAWAALGSPGRVRADTLLAFHHYHILILLWNPALLQDKHLGPLSSAVLAWWHTLNLSWVTPGVSAQLCSWAQPLKRGQLWGAQEPGLIFYWNTCMYKTFGCISLQNV